MLDPKWKEVLIKSPYTELTKFDVYSYYSDDKVKQELLNDIRNHKVLVRQVLGKELLKRKDPYGNYIRIQKAEPTPEGVQDPQNLYYWTHRRTTEFHKVFDTDTKEYVIDIDPGPGVDFNTTKKITLIVNEVLKNLPEVEKTELRFSGGRGFYVVGYIKNKKHIDEAREKLKKVLEPLQEELPVTFSKPDLDEIRLDLSPMKRMGSYRAKYSLNTTTGLVSIPLDEEQLINFRKTDALPIKVLGNRIPEIVILKE